MKIYNKRTHELKKNLLLNTLDRSQKKKKTSHNNFSFVLEDSISKCIMEILLAKKKKKKVPLKNLGFYNVREF